MQRLSPAALLGMLLLLGQIESACGQAVRVSVSLDRPLLVVGEETTLRVYAQIAPEVRATSDRIFSWYVDLLNEDGNVARVNSRELLRPNSENDPLTSSTGHTDGHHLRGVYDTFLGLERAGRDAPVELFAVPIQAIAVGRTLFRVAAGTGVPALSTDFLVAPAEGNEPLLGGDYASASVALEVTATPVLGPALSLVATPTGTNEGLRVTLTFSPVAGSSHWVESRANLNSETSWQPLPGGPHNAGSASETTTEPSRFYRIRITTP